MGICWDVCKLTDDSKGDVQRKKNRPCVSHSTPLGPHAYGRRSGPTCIGIGLVKPRSKSEPTSTLQPRSSGPSFGVVPPNRGVQSLVMSGEER